MSELIQRFWMSSDSDKFRIKHTTLHKFSKHVTAPEKFGELLKRFELEPDVEQILKVEDDLILDDIWYQFHELGIEKIWEILTYDHIKSLKGDDLLIAFMLESYKK